MLSPPFQCRYNLQSFELSAAFVNFWDKLEKTNTFLEGIIEKALLIQEASDPNTSVDQSKLQAALDERLHLLWNPVVEGGLWSMLVNLIIKYGLVPKNAYKDTFSSGVAVVWGKYITSKAHEWAVVLEGMVKKGATLEELRAQKKDFLVQTYKLLVISFGEPPKRFNWSATTRDNKLVTFKDETPLEFLKKHIDGSFMTTVNVVHDPRNAYWKKYTSSRTVEVNLIEGRRGTSLNMPMDALKALTIKMIKAQIPVYFVCDVSQFAVYREGVLDQAIFDYESTLDMKFVLPLSRADRIDTWESRGTHAMLITGVHLDPETKKPTKWKIMNSWGTSIAKQGFLVMSDDWFTEFVFNVMINEQFLDQEALKALRDEDVIVYPRYDPFGSTLLD